MAKKGFSIDVTAGVGLTSTRFAGSIMNKHVRKVINEELNPLLMKSFREVTSDWSSGNQPDFQPIRAKRQLAIWNFGVSVEGPEGITKEIKRNAAGIPLPGGGKEKLTSRSLFTMLDKGREGGAKIQGKTRTVRERKSSGFHDPTHGLASRATMQFENVEKKSPLFWQQYSPKTTTTHPFKRAGGGTYSGKLFKKDSVTQGAIPARNFTGQIIKFHRQNKDIKKALDRGYRRAVREIVKGQKKTAVSK